MDRVGPAWPQTVREMLEGWRNQQLCRNLALDIEGRIRLVERF
jgi:integrase/recombinase XerD